MAKKQSGKKDKTMFRTVKSKEFPYATTDKRLVRDWRIDWGTRGLLAMILSFPEDWEVRFDHLLNASPAGRTKLRRYIKEAVDHGYMYREKYWEDGGYKWVTLVFENPDENPYWDEADHPEIEQRSSVGYTPISQPVENVPLQSVENVPLPQSVENVPLWQSVENVPLWQSVGNRPIYIYLWFLTEYDGKNTKNKEQKQLIFDDDGSLSMTHSVFSVLENDQVFARDKGDFAQIVAGWCAAMAIDWLPEWSGGERFADDLNDKRLHTLATWMWTWHELNDRPHSMDRQYFIQRNGNGFDGIDNPVGKIVTQVRLGNDAPLTDYDKANCAAAALRWSDAAATLLGAEDDTGVPW